MSSGIDYHGTTPTNQLEYLAPAFRAAVEAAIQECNAKNLDAMVYETYRSNELQALYYTRGRTVRPPDTPVTNAMTNLYSWHGYGLAVDVIHRQHRWNRPKSWFEEVAKIFLAHGCKWGGHWTSEDLPHFQWGLCRASPSHTARDIMRSKGVAAVWQAVGALAPIAPVLIAPTPPTPAPTPAPAPPAPAAPPPPAAASTVPTPSSGNAMSKSVFKGAIDAGTISATLQSNAANADPDLLIITYIASGEQNAKTDQRAIAPGGAGTVSVAAPKTGVLEVWIKAGVTSDRGRLSVKREGTVVSEEDTQGSVRWVYSVE